MILKPGGGVAARKNLDAIEARQAQLAAEIKKVSEAGYTLEETLGAIKADIARYSEMGTAVRRLDAYSSSYQEHRDQGSFALKEALSIVGLAALLGTDTVVKQIEKVIGESVNSRAGLPAKERAKKLAELAEERRRAAIEAETETMRLMQEGHKVLRRDDLVDVGILFEVWAAADARDQPPSAQKRASK
jgi:sugar phosphate isomerase/epimerase